jgi:Leucine-rich repeat (LRR) protein
MKNIILLFILVFISNFAKSQNQNIIQEIANLQVIYDSTTQFKSLKTTDGIVLLDSVVGDISIYNKNNSYYGYYDYNYHRHDDHNYNYEYDRGDYGLMSIATIDSNDNFKLYAYNKQEGLFAVALSLKELNDSHKGIMLRCDKCRKIPKKILKHKALKYLSISSDKKIKISAEISNLSNLKYLSLLNADISIKELSKCTNLSFLQLTIIDNINIKDINLLENLEYLGILGSNLQQIEPNSIRLPNLKTLIIGSNKNLRSIHTDALVLPQLKSLLIHENKQLWSIGIFDAKNLPNLEYLSLNGNKEFKEIYPSQIVEFTKLSTLEILDSPQPFMLISKKYPYPNLKNMSIMSYEFDKSIELHKAVPLLETLNIFCDEIDTLNYNDFKALKHLSFLSIESSQINRIVNMDTVLLKSLNLSTSKSKVFPNIYAPNLEYLDLSANELKVFPNIYAPNLEYLDLGVNDLTVFPNIKVQQTTDDALNLKNNKLKHLNLKSNYIAKIGASDLKSYNSIEYLNLAENPITDIDYTAFNLPNLSEIDIQFRISDYYIDSTLDYSTLYYSKGLPPLAELKKIKKLKKLSINVGKDQKIPDDYIDWFIEQQFERLQLLELAQPEKKRLKKRLKALYRFPEEKHYKQNLYIALKKKD